jgi:hypothetical protein
VSDLDEVMRVSAFWWGYDELKTKRTVNLTDTAWGLLKDRATQKGISISEHIEIWARSEGIDNQRSGDRD